jgi:hypothetical protein
MSEEKSTNEILNQILELREVVNKEVLDVFKRYVKNCKFSCCKVDCNDCRKRACENWQVKYGSVEFPIEPGSLTIAIPRKYFELYILIPGEQLESDKEEEKERELRELKRLLVKYIDRMVEEG